MNVSLIVGENITRLRKVVGLSQEELGATIGLSRGSIANIEMGRHSTTAEKLVKICAVLKCEYKDILPPIPTADIKMKEFKVVKRRVVSAKFK